MSFHLSRVLGKTGEKVIGVAAAPFTGGASLALLDSNVKQRNRIAAGVIGVEAAAAGGYLAFAGTPATSAAQPFGVGAAAGSSSATSYAGYAGLAKTGLSTLGSYFSSRNPNSPDYVGVNPGQAAFAQRAGYANGPAFDRVNPALNFGASSSPQMMYLVAGGAVLLLVLVMMTKR